MEEEFVFEWSLFTQLKKNYDETELLKGFVFTHQSGVQYRNVHFNNQTKTLCYEMKIPNERWSGLIHGRLMRDFLEMSKEKIEASK